MAGPQLFHEARLIGLSTNWRRPFAPPKGPSDSSDPVGHQGVQGQVLAITVNASLAFAELNQSSTNHP